MKQTKIFLLASALIALTCGCSVDKEFSGESLKKINTEMTLFQNGLTVPLIRNTVEIYADSIISNIQDSTARDLFKIADGKYEIRYRGYENLDSLIKNFGLEDALKINPINIEDNVSFEFGDLDPDKFKSEQINFGDDISLPDLSEASDIRITPLDKTISVDTGLKDTGYDISVNVNPFQRNQTIFPNSIIRQAGELSPVDAVTLPNSTITLDLLSETIPAFEIPSSIETINSVTLNDNSRVSITLSLSNSILTEGTITPNIEVNLSDFLNFAEGGGSLDLSSIVLDASNGFSATRNYPISGINIAKLDKEKSVTVTGSIAVSGAKSTKAKCASSTGDLGINISVGFPELGVNSVVCKIKDITTTVNENVSVAIDDITLPKEVESVEYVTFSESSKLSMQISASNLEKISGAAMKAEYIKVTFPEEMVVSGSNVTDNVLSISNVNLREGYNAVFNVTRLNLPAPKNGKISLSPQIKVEAKCTANGTINTADLKTLASDISVSAKMTGSLSVADFQATVNEYNASLPQIEGTLSFDVPEKAASYGPITIIPEGSPSISLQMSVPDIGGISVSAGNGIKVNLPYFIVLGDISDPDVEYNKGTNVLTLKAIKDKTYIVPIEKLVASAEKSETGYKISGKYSVEGALSIGRQKIDKGTLDRISKAKLGFKAIVPSIKASKISVESLSFDVNENISFEILKSSDIPDMLAGVGEVALKDVTAKLGLELQGLPSIGSKSKFVLDLKADLPSFIKPSTVNIQGEIINGKFESQPIHIEGFNLDDFDFPKMKSEGESLKGAVAITGRIYAENPEVDLKTVSGKVNGKIKANFSDPEGKIKIENITAKLDYQIDTTFSFGMVDFMKKLGDVHFDLPDVTAIVGMRSNLAIPVSGRAKIVPVKDNREKEELAITKNLTFPYCAPPAQTDTVTNTLGFDLNGILNSKCDSVRIYAQLNTDKSRDCYVEPKTKYSLRLGYDLSIPLQPKSEFRMAYADTLNLEGALNGFENIISNSSIGITGRIENTFPIGIKVRISFLNFDKDKGTYSVLPLKEIETDLLNPNTESQVEIITGPEKPGTALPEITHLRFSLDLSSDGKAISPDSYLKIKDINLVLPEGATIDPANM